ncbi:MAG: single-stranded-DNA-specific exonuclease RecJ [Gammaproteobacteria bacterium]|nr:single-stranded-DNA-specific exonuclease RecJ [Gammaproteobacteria bacterium]
MILSKNKWKLLFENQYEDEEIIDILYKLKGIDDYVNYFNLGFKDFLDPYLFKNMDIVVKKIKSSIKNNDKILIYGDYDVDGITATSILYRILKEKGADVYYMLPNRFQTGYGLNTEVIEDIINSQYNLVITVDNGITSIEEIDKLISCGITVILTDHHEPKDDIPHTPYIIHSYIHHDYPFEGLCGAGVAFKLAEAIDKDYIRQYVDLAMLGTIADMMPQVGENMAFINEGLKLINKSNLLGLRTLLERLNINIKGIKDISYNIAPKLNALGRIGDASFAVDLLTTNDINKINDDIDKILEADRIRKELTIQNTELAYKMINENDKVNVIYSNEFYEGVLGIIAQKVVKKTSKITGIFTIDSDGLAKGSFRGLGDYNLLALLENASDLIDKFGGHENACGLTLKASNLKLLKDRLSEELDQTISTPSIEVALKLNHTLLNLDFYKTLEMYELQDTTFLFKNLEVVGFNLLADKHSKIRCKTSAGTYINVLVFQDPYLYYNVAIGDKIDFIGYINLNVYNGSTYLQIIANDYSISSIQVIDYRKRRDYELAKPYLNTETGLVLEDSFDNLSELALLIKEQSPIIVYLANNPFNSMIDDVTNINKLKEAIFYINQNFETSELILQKQLKLRRDSLDIMLKMFEELELVTRTNGIVSPLPREKGFKVSLESSETYLYYKNKAEINNFLNSPINDIKEYVLKALE